MNRIPKLYSVIRVSAFIASATLSQAQSTAPTTCPTCVTTGVYSVKSFGAKGDGSSDDTAAIQAAVNSCPSNGCTVMMPTGNYKITSTIIIARDQINLVGQGRGATTLIYVPHQAGSAILVSKPYCGNAPCSDIVRNSIRDFLLYSPDTSLPKVGIKLVATSEAEIEHVNIAGAGSGGAWSGGSPGIGLQIQGHELARIAKLSINADEPISIQTNPLTYANGAIRIDIDQFHFQDMYLIANGYPCVEIGDPVQLTQVTFDGMESWVGGTYGLYWNDLTDVGASNGLNLSNVRTEQGTNSTAYSVWISAIGRQIQNVTISGMSADPGRNGLYFRGTHWTSVQNFIYGGASEALDADGSNQMLTVHNSFFQVGSSVGQATAIRSASNGNVNTTP